MTATDELKVLLGLFAGSLPTILVCIVAIFVVSTRGPRLAGAVPWALLGFGLLVVLSVAAPLSQVLLQRYFASHYLSFDKNGWMFGVLSVFNSALHAAGLIFLLVAVCSGRAPGLISPAPPLPRV